MPARRHRRDGSPSESQLHLHRARAVRRQVKRTDRICQRNDLGQQRHHINRARRKEEDRPGKFLVEAEGAAQGDFLGNQDIEGNCSLAAGNADLNDRPAWSDRLQCAGEGRPAPDASNATSKHPLSAPKGTSACGSVATLSAKSAPTRLAVANGASVRSVTAICRAPA